MKKLMALICAAAMVFSLAACGAKEAPDKVVNEFCQHMTAFDLEAMAGCVEGGKVDADDAMGEDAPEAILTHMKENAQKMTFTVTETASEENEGSVSVKFSYPDLSPAFKATIGEFITQGLGLAIAGASDEEMNELFESIFEEQLAKAEPEMTEAAVKFDCVMTEEGWKIAEVPEEVMNIMMGNGLSVLESMDEAGDEKTDEEDLIHHKVAMGEEAQLATMKAKATACSEETVIKSDWSEETAGEGTKYVIFTVTFENTSKEPFTVSADDFPLYDDQGRKYSCDSGAMIGLEDAMQYRELAPNMPETGVIVYNVPEDCEGYYFTAGKAGTNDVYDFLGA